MKNTTTQSSILMTSDLSEESYQLFIDKACKTYAFFSVIFRFDLKSNPNVLAILEEMKSNQYKIIYSKKLPMNEIHTAYSAEIHYFTTTPRIIRPILKKVGRSLFLSRE
jgi:hypothetical protein